MKPYTWEEISKAKKAERKLIVETYGLLGAVAIEVAQALNDAEMNLDIGNCNVNKYLGQYELCPLEDRGCSYEEEDAEAWTKWYAELYKKAYGKKK